MAWTKLKIGVVAGTLAILAAGTATVTIQHARATAAAPFSFSGYATPEASVASMLWAGSVGDFEKAMESCTPEQQDRIRAKMAGKSPEDVRRETVAWAKALSGYKITQTEVIADDEVRLHIQAKPSAAALHNGQTVVVMKRIGNEWKQSGEAD
jgi:hypothetical protein